MKKFFRIAAVAMAVVAAGCFMSCSEEEDDVKTLAEILGVEIPKIPEFTPQETAGPNQVTGKTYVMEDEAEDSVDEFVFDDLEVIQTTSYGGVVVRRVTFTYICDASENKVYAAAKEGEFIEDGKSYKFTDLDSLIRCFLKDLLAAGLE